MSLSFDTCMRMVWGWTSAFIEQVVYQAFSWSIAWLDINSFLPSTTSLVCLRLGAHWRRRERVFKITLTRLTVDRIWGTCRWETIKVMSCLLLKHVRYKRTSHRRLRCPWLRFEQGQRFLPRTTRPVLRMRLVRF